MALYVSKNDVIESKDIKIKEYTKKNFDTCHIAFALNSLSPIRTCPNAENMKLTAK